MTQELSMFFQEITGIIDEAESKRIPLRLIGGAAIRYHCPNSQKLYDNLGRITKMDMDFITYGRYKHDVRKLFKSRGYVPYITLLMATPSGKDRQIYNDSEGNKAIDVFFDRLPMCHDIVIKGTDRLEKDKPTWPLAEQLLSKLQIVKLNAKDVVDTIILLREHDIGKDDDEKVNAPIIAKTLSNDWGFCYTVTQNIKNVNDLLRDYAHEGKISADDSFKIEERLTTLENYIAEEPKTLKWTMRSKIGTKKQWYRLPEEVQR